MTVLERLQKIAIDVAGVDPVADDGRAAVLARTAVAMVAVELGYSERDVAEFLDVAKVTYYLRGKPGVPPPRSPLITDVLVPAMRAELGLGGAA